MAKILFTLLTRYCLYFSFGFNTLPVLAQDQSTTDELTKEQYELITLTYHQDKNDELKLYHQSIGDPSWIERLLDLKSEDYLFLHKFTNAELPLLLEKLPELSSELSIKSWDKKQLGSRTKLRKKRDDDTTIYMAEPIIQSNYAFVLIRKPKSESVYIYFRDPELGWTEECVVPLAYVIECYG
ncbi:hypothetical protein [Algoriphagus litoralis]|uniref:hypothetical protein n=1 Tax=Algoriphagus litoralis TaxID=2202829 RepID=UPI000DBA0869|nr:hypothetical protein [Algoriphagus litoralis]